MREPVLSGRSQSSKYRFSQRVVLWVLATLLILGGGFTWLVLSQYSFGFTVNSALTTTSPTAFTPITTPSTPSATLAPSPTPTATPSPTAMPSPTAAPSPTATPSHSKP